jgi:hypothetical protein
MKTFYFISGILLMIISSLLTTVIATFIAIMFIKGIVISSFMCISLLYLGIRLLYKSDKLKRNEAK